MNKTKYLVTDTWNGQGYSDCDIEILEVENYPNGTPKVEELKKRLMDRIVWSGQSTRKRRLSL